MCQHLCLGPSPLRWLQPQPQPVSLCLHTGCSLPSLGLAPHQEPLIREREPLTQPATLSKLLILYTPGFLFCKSGDSGSICLLVVMTGCTDLLACVWPTVSAQ